LQGYKRALAERGLPYKPHYVVEGNFQLASGERAMQTLLNLAERPSAVFAANDLMAIGAIKALQSSGLHVPNDVAVVGYDDIALASIISPSLTTLAMPKHELGEAAAELILHRLRATTTTTAELVVETPPSQNVRMLHATLVRRESA
jgi:LacI family transcriptional regulator